MSIFKAKSLGNNTWLIEDEKWSCTTYLVVGEKEAAMIDSGLAYENIREFAMTLTNKPVNKVINTHGHFDHCGNNWQFPEVYMHQEAEETGKTVYASRDASKYQLDYPIHKVGDGDTIDLGGRILEIFEIPAHNDGSIAILDVTGRYLFTGDEYSPVSTPLIWLQEKEQPTVERFYKNGLKLKTRIDDFDWVLGGHSKDRADKSVIVHLIEHAQRIMEGNHGEPMVDKGDGPPDFFLPEPEHKRFSEYKNTRIMYDIRYLRNQK